jgi:hypothetical protein
VLHRWAAPECRSVAEVTQSLQITARSERSCMRFVLALQIAALVLLIAVQCASLVSAEPRRLLQVTPRPLAETQCAAQASFSDSYSLDAAAFPYAVDYTLTGDATSTTFVFKARQTLAGGSGWARAQGRGAASSTLSAAPRPALSASSVCRSVRPRVRLASRCASPWLPSSCGYQTGCWQAEPRSAASLH